MNQQNLSKTQSPRGAKRVNSVAGYPLLARLGEGGSGTVFKSIHPQTKAPLAIKILSPKLHRDPEYLQRFQNEARAAAQVEHPSIVKILSAGYDEKIDVPYITYEFIDGMSLTQLVESRGPLKEAQALAITRCMADALGALWDAGLVHRDVKPDNILMTRSGQPKLSDLGLAKQEADWDTITATGIVMGTPDYMAPEQATGSKDLDLSTDIYALGLTLYVMLAAELPFCGDSLVELLRSHLEEDCPDPREKNPEVGRETSKLLAFMAHRDRGQRYRSSGPLVRDIDLILAGKSIIGPGRSPRRSARRRTARPEGGDGPDIDPMASAARRREPGYRKRSFAGQYVFAFLIGGLLAFLVFGLPRLLRSAPAGPRPLEAR